MGSDDFSWRDLMVIVKHLPRESAVYRTTEPDAWDWDRRTEFLASAVDSLRLLVWAKTEDAEKGRNQPEPIARPEVLTAPDEPVVDPLQALDDTWAWLEEINGPRAIAA